MKGFKCTLRDTHTNELSGVVLIKAESYDEAFLKINRNYCHYSTFVIDEVVEISLEDIKIIE